MIRLQWLQLLARNWELKAKLGGQTKTTSASGWKL